MNKYPEVQPPSIYGLWYKTIDDKGIERELEWYNSDCFETDTYGYWTDEENEEYENIEYWFDNENN